jgi:hypothetical protein
MRHVAPICLGLAAVCAVAAGCSDDRSNARYVPPAEAARQALKAALRSWQEGRPAGKLEGTSPAVILVDNCRSPGQGLTDFTILGEAPGEGPRCFAVRLRLDNPAEERRVRFVVFGIDPLWVFRYEDYEMMIHWECSGNEGDGKAARSHH